MNILAFDTSGNSLSTCLISGDELYEENRTSGLKHSEYLLPSVDRLMKQAELDYSELDLIVCTKGPGSFTGLRIGMSTAKGLSAGCDTPIISVNILDAYAAGFNFFPGVVVPVIDARKQRFYTAVFKDGERLSDYLDISAEDLAGVLNNYEEVLFTGPAAFLITDIFNSSKIDFKPTLHYFKQSSGISNILAELGKELYQKNGPDSDDSGPMYIRLSDAELGRK